MCSLRRPSLAPEGTSPSLMGLTGLLVAHGSSAHWPAMCDAWDGALQAAFDMHGVVAAERFVFR